MFRCRSCTSCRTRNSCSSSSHRNSRLVDDYEASRPHLDYACIRISWNLFLFRFYILVFNWQSSFVLFLTLFMTRPYRRKCLWLSWHPTSFIDFHDLRKVHELHGNDSLGTSAWYDTYVTRRLKLRLSTTPASTIRRISVTKGSEGRKSAQLTIDKRDKGKKARTMDQWWSWTRSETDGEPRVGMMSVSLKRWGCDSFSDPNPILRNKENLCKLNQTSYSVSQARFALANALVPLTPLAVVAFCSETKQRKGTFLLLLYSFAILMIIVLSCSPQETSTSHKTSTQAFNPHKLTIAKPWYIIDLLGPDTDQNDCFCDGWDGRWGKPNDK